MLLNVSYVHIKCEIKIRKDNINGSISLIDCFILMLYKY